MNDFFGFLLCIVLALATGVILGAALEKQYQRSLAIKANVGQYVADPETGSTTFKYGVGK